MELLILEKPFKVNMENKFARSFPQFYARQVISGIERSMLRYARQHYSGKIPDGVSIAAYIYAFDGFERGRKIYRKISHHIITVKGGKKWN